MHLIFSTLRSVSSCSCDNGRALRDVGLFNGWSFFVSIRWLQSSHLRLKRSQPVAQLI